MHNMEWWQALVLGIVEGVTEYLPVSSTGHLILAQHALGLPLTTPQQKIAADAYAICIQAGAILAVLGLYWRRMKQAALGVVGKDPAGLRLAANLALAFAATVVSYKLAEKLLAKLLHTTVKDALFHVKPVTLAWFVGGLAILAMVYLRPRRDALRNPGRALDDLSLKHALIIGVMQAIAVWPGTSRSLITIVAGLLVGLTLSAAVEFSFLLGVVTLLAATVKDATEHGRLMYDQYGWHALAIGFIAAAISAALAVQWMVGYLRRHSLAVFGWYRVALAIIVAVLLLAGVLT